MLELADTMIDLKLPVLLVAPKDTSYTFLKQDGDIREGTEPRPVAPPEGAEMRMTKPKQRTRSSWAWGRHIPGMLVISSITFLRDRPRRVRLLGDLQACPPGPDAGRHGDPVRGPLGYAALMTQVAGASPRRFPLLNGGSILGYLVSGAIAIGVENLWQDITF